MAGGVEGGAHRPDAARHPGGGLVVHDRHRLDGVIAILGESRLDPCRIGAGAPVAFQDLGLQAESPRHRRPQRREVPGLAHQHRVAGRERVHERRLPGAGAGRREDQHVAASAEDLAQAGEHPLAEPPELRPAMVDGGALDGAQDPIGDVGGAGNLEEVPAGRGGHGSVSPESRSAACPAASRSVRRATNARVYRPNPSLTEASSPIRLSDSARARFAASLRRRPPPARWPRARQSRCRRRASPAHRRSS